MNELNAVVIGAGGTSRAACFALSELGFKNVHIYNRTQSKTVELIKHLNDTINGTRLVFFF